MNRILILSLSLVALLGLAACSDDDVTGPTNNANGFEAAASPDFELKPGGMTIAEIAKMEGFSLLLAAVDYIAATNPESGLVAGISDKSQYTVFAPTDKAFLALVAAVEDLLDPEIVENEGVFAAIDALLGPGKVEAVVSYHVVEGRRSSRSVVPRNGERSIQTLLDGATFTVDNGGKIDAVGSDAQIDAADVSASNGIIHVIDTVLLPLDLGL
jgi:uncharacterized surface protein with fasciclin (FAS1) repeats